MGSKGLPGLVVVALLLVAVWWTSQPRPFAEAPAVVRPHRVAPATPAEPVAAIQTGAAGSAADSGARPLQASDDSITVAVHTRLAQADHAPATPIAARVELGVSPGYQVAGPVLAEVQTDADGSASVTLPWSALAPGDDGRSPRIWARSAAPGRLTSSATAQAPGEPGGQTRFDLLLRPGTLVEGQLLGPDGEPVAGRISWWHFGEGIATGGSGQRAGTDGRFAVELTREGSVALQAQGSRPVGAPGSERPRLPQDDLGTGLSERFEVRFDQPTPFVEIHIAGPGVLRGRVLDAAGKPAAGVSLQAIVAAVDDQDGAAVPADLRQQLELQGRGHSWMLSETDSDGTFLFTGLRDDLFHLRANTEGRVFGGHALLLTPTPVPSDSLPLDLRLTRTHLAVHVRHADGSPAAEVEERVRGTYDADIEDWPEQPELAVSLALDALPVDARRPWLQTRAVDPGEFVVDLEGGVSVDVGLVGGALRYAPQRVEVPVGAGRIDVELVLADPLPLGGLVLSATDARGEPLVDEVVIRLVDPDSGVLLLERPCTYLSPDDWPQRLALPEGRYLLLVEGQARVDDHHGTVWELRQHGAFEREVLVRAGVEQQLTCVLGEPARLALRLEGSADEADREALRARSKGGSATSGDPSPERAAYIETWSAYVTLRLLRPGRWPRAPLFAREFRQNTSADGTHLMDGLSLGDEALTEPLTPGSYTLAARTPGGREVRRDVVLHPGQTTTVTLSFE